MNIFVANLSSRVQKEDLERVFGEYGQVDIAKVIYDKETGNSRGFGFVEMPNDSEGYEAIKNLNEAEWDGKNIVVKKARPKTQENAGPRDNNRRFDNNFRGGGGPRKFDNNRRNFNNR
ncbi:MAG: RNA recognition motif domain-containing protein [Hyphomicrobiales bacterium]